ncbi:MAG: hypothetical protein ACREJR_07475 [Candidatus Rokuibacteriota bacterium]
MDSVGGDGSRRLTRRQLLTRTGFLGAAIALGPTLLGSNRAGAGPLDRLLGADPGLLNTARRILGQITIDTYRGLVVFVAPGNDALSRHQGAFTDRPGALDARADSFVSDALDDFIPLPDAVLRPVVRALATSLDDAGVPVAPSLLGGLLDTALLDELGEAVDQLLANDQTIPLSGLIALLLNVEATAVDPTSVIGPFNSPFARLSSAEKAAVFRNLEDPRPDLVALIDANFPQPLRASVSGILRFTAGALIEFSAFATFSEYGTFDHATRTVTARPVGWDLSSYLPGRTTPPDGSDDLLGYYQGRRSVG